MWWYIAGFRQGTAESYSLFGVFKCVGQVTTLLNDHNVQGYVCGHYWILRRTSNGGRERSV